MQWYEKKHRKKKFKTISKKKKKNSINSFSYHVLIKTSPAAVNIA